MLRSCLLALALLLAAAGLRANPADSGRYLYVIGCDATVDKLDTVTERKSGYWNLAERTGPERLIPSVRGGLDGCLAWHAVYDPRAAVFYAVVPLSARLKSDGTQDYRLLVFSVPDLRLVKTMPAGEHLDDPPYVRIRTTEGPRIVPASEWAPRTDLDLSAYAPEKTQTPNQLLESSGERALLRVFTANEHELVLAVADRQSRTLVRLRDLPPTVAPNVHLAPGGGSVLVQATSGELVLYDANTGAQVRRFSDPLEKSMHFLAISPGGKAIYHSAEKYQFVNLGTTFGSAPVTRPSAENYPGLFFADE